MKNKMEMESKDRSVTYKTKDLGEAAALIIHQQTFLVTRREGSVCWFEFAEKEKCLEISHKYYFGELLVNARDFHEALARLKTIIFSQK